MRKPILLIGMMGCSKSTVGRLLAERMRLPLIDLDEEIARGGKNHPEIFAQEGEAGFSRARNSGGLSALAREAGVIATSGGIVTRAGEHPHDA